MKDAGIRWVRTGFSFPFADRIGDTLTEDYLRDKEYARRWIERGFKLIGICFYRWEDQETCWQCGSPTCPMETAWGLVDTKNKPKPAYYSFQEGVERLRME